MRFFNIYFLKFYLCDFSCILLGVVFLKVFIVLFKKIKMKEKQLQDFF